MCVNTHTLQASDSWLSSQARAQEVFLLLERERDVRAQVPASNEVLV